MSVIFLLYLKFCLDFIFKKTNYLFSLYILIPIPTPSLPPIPSTFLSLCQFFLTLLVCMLILSTLLILKILVSCFAFIIFWRLFLCLFVCVCSHVFMIFYVFECQTWMSDLTLYWVWGNLLVFHLYMNQSSWPEIF